MITDLITGISKYFDALAFMRSNGLMRYFAYSGLIGLVILFVIFTGVYFTYDHISGYFLSLLPWDLGFLNTLSDVISIALMSLSFFLVYKYLVLIFTAPVMSLLSEKAERILDGEEESSEAYQSQILKEIIRGARLSLRNVIREIVLTLLLLILSLLPGIAIAASPLIFLVQSYYAGFGNYDFWAERHFTYRGTINFIRDHRAMVTGNGIVFVFLLAIPVLGVFVAPPLATVASTMHGSERLKQYDN